MKKYDYINNFKEGLAIVGLNGKEGVINKQGKEICSIKYDCVYRFEQGLARVKLNGKYGFINKEGKEICSIKYDWIFDFNEGLARVKLNGKWGYINELGEKVIPLIYDNLYHFNEEYYHGRIDNKHYLIDKTTLIPMECRYNVHKNIGSRYDDLEVYYTDDYSIVLFKTGCFRGDLEEFKEAVIRTHNNSKNMKYYNEYMDIIEKYEIIKYNGIYVYSLNDYDENVVLTHYIKYTDEEFLNMCFKIHNELSSYEDNRSVNTIAGILIKNYGFKEMIIRMQL